MWLPKQIALFFALNRTTSSANEKGTKQPIKFQGLLKVTNQIGRKWKTKETICLANFANSVPNWINKILALTKILYFSN